MTKTTTTKRGFNFRYWLGVRYVAAWNDAPSTFTRCGHCGRAWDDEKPTGLTPTPAARCPFEDWHQHGGCAS